MTEHWCSLEQAGAGRWRSVCNCGWISDAFTNSLEATEAGLAHTSMSAPSPDERTPAR